MTSSRAGGVFIFTNGTSKAWLRWNRCRIDVTIGRSCTEQWLCLWCYFFSCLVIIHGVNMNPMMGLRVVVSISDWPFLFSHAAACAGVGRWGASTSDDTDPHCECAAKWEAASVCEGPVQSHYPRDTSRWKHRHYRDSHRRWHQSKTYINNCYLS